MLLLPVITVSIYKSCHFALVLFKFMSTDVHSHKIAQLSTWLEHTCQTQLNVRPSQAHVFSMCPHRGRAVTCIITSECLPCVAKVMYLKSLWSLFSNFNNNNNKQYILSLEIFINYLWNKNVHCSISGFWAVVFLLREDTYVHGYLIKGRHMYVGTAEYIHVTFIKIKI